MRIDYRLPISVVRVVGEITTSVDSGAPPSEQKTVTATATTSVDVRADPAGKVTLLVPAQDASELNLKLALLPDGRLVGSDATFDDRSGERMTAVLAAGIAGASAAAPFATAAGPAGAALALAAGVISAGMAAASVSTGDVRGFGIINDPDNPDRLAEDVCDPKKPEQPSAADLGIHIGFQEAHPAEHDVLVQYRTALLYLSAAHAETVKSAYLNPLRALDEAAALERLLGSTRREAQRVEETYRLWRASLVTTEIEKVTLELRIDELPTTAQFDKQRNKRGGANDPAWWSDVATKLRTMVTCDLLGTMEPISEAERAFDDGTILYIEQSPALLTSWKLRKRDKAAGWDASREAVEYALVSHPRGLRSIRLPLRASSDASVSATFDPGGALTGVETRTLGAAAARAETLSALPAALAAAGSSGSAIVQPFSAAGRATALKGRVEELEQRAKIQGLLNPSTDKLADKREELAEAEVDARIAMARRMITDPSSVVFVSSTPSD